MAHPLWPLFDLRIRSEHLVLRLPTDDELIELAELARSGIHDAAEMPFGVPWTQRQSPEFETGFIQHHWSMRATFAPQRISTPSAACRRATISAISAGMPRLRTRGWPSISVTVAPSLRALAASSSPMNPPPSMAIWLPSIRCARMRAASSWLRSAAMRPP